MKLNVIIAKVKIGTLISYERLNRNTNKIEEVQGYVGDIDHEARVLLIKNKTEKILVPVGFDQFQSLVKKDKRCFLSATIMSKIITLNKICCNFYKDCIFEEKEKFSVQISLSSIICNYSEGLLYKVVGIHFPKSEVYAQIVGILDRKTGDYLPNLLMENEKFLLKFEDLISLRNIESIDGVLRNQIAEVSFGANAEVKLYKNHVSKTLDKSRNLCNEIPLNKNAVESCVLPNKEKVEITRHNIALVLKWNKIPHVLYLIDQENSRISIYDKNQNFLNMISFKNPKWLDHIELHFGKLDSLVKPKLGSGIAKRELIKRGFSHRTVGETEFFAKNGLTFFKNVDELHLNVDKGKCKIRFEPSEENFKKIDQIIRILESLNCHA